jgi:hypothetical protein
MSIPWRRPLALTLNADSARVLWAMAWESIKPTPLWFWELP